MKRFLACTLIMPLALSMTLFMTAMVSTKAEAASKEELRNAETTLLAEKVYKGEVPGFKALSEYDMSYKEAVAFCKRNGGRLPRINNSNMWDGKNPPLRGVLIDGFGYGGRPWNEVGLQDGYFYWTDTIAPDKNVLVVNKYQEVVAVYTRFKYEHFRVVCVP